MGKHRSRLKILAKILSIVSANNGARKTQIMYQAYLSYKLLVRYLDDLTQAELVRCENGTCYELTSKGKVFLTRFNEYSESCKFVEKQLNQIEYQKSTLEEMFCQGEQSDID